MAPQHEFAIRTTETVAKQLVVTGAVAVILIWMGYWGPAKGVLFGGGLAGLLALLLSGNLQRVINSRDLGSTKTLIYVGAAERFLILAVGVTLAFSVFDLNGGGLISGLILAHIISFVEAVRHFGSKSLS